MNSIQYYRVAEAFEADCVYYARKENKPSGWTIQEIKTMIDTYGMVMIYMPNTYGGGHWMVFTGYTNGNNFANSFYIYDPYASTKAAGANLLLSNTTSGCRNTRIEDLLIVVAYD